MQSARQPDGLFVAFSLFIDLRIEVCDMKTSAAWQYPMSLQRCAERPGKRQGNVLRTLPCQVAAFHAAPQCADQAAATPVAF